MSYSKQFAIDEIIRMASEMLPATTHCSIKFDHLALHERTAELSMEIVREGYKWLRDVYESSFAEWAKVRALVSEEQWGRYELWGGFHNHREVVMLKKVSLELRNILISRVRPDLFKKGKVNGELKRTDQAKRGKPKKQSKASQRVEAASGEDQSGDQQPS